MTRTVQREAQASSSPRQHDAQPSAHNRNLVLLWAGQFVNTAGLMMLVPIMPFYLEGMGTSGTTETQTWAGVAIAAPALALTVATPLWGRLGDRIGRKWMVVRSLLGLVVAMAVMAAATTPVLLVVGRLLQGTLGGVVEAAAAFAGSAGSDKKRGSSLGKSFSATAAGALAGPIAGGLFVGAGGLRQLMLVIAAVAAVLAVCCAAGLREPERTRPHDEQPTDPHRQARRRPSAMRVPGAIPLVLAAIAAYFGSYGLIPVFAEQVKGVVSEPGTASLWTGVLHSVMWGATLIGSFWWGRHNDLTKRPVRTFAIAAAGSAASIAVLSLPLGVIAFIPLRLVQGFCFAALAQSLFLHFSHHAPDEHKSSYVSTANSFLLIGQSAGPLLAGPMVALMPIPTAVLSMAIASAVACLLLLGPTQREKRSWEDPELSQEDSSAPMPVITNSGESAQEPASKAGGVAAHPFRGWLMAPQHLRDLAGRYATPWGDSAGPEDASSAKTANILRAWQRNGTLVHDRRPSYYVYQQTGPRGTQKGLITSVHLDSTVIGHAHVIPERMNGVADVIADGQMNLAPVLLGYSSKERTNSHLNTATRQPPVLETLTSDGQRHRLWRITEPEAHVDIADELSQTPALIADGHHRHIAARQYRQELHAAGYGPGPWDYLTGMLVDTRRNPMHIAPVHRVLPSLDARTALDKAATRFRVLRLRGELRDWLRALKQHAHSGPAFLVTTQQGTFLLTAANQDFFAHALGHLPAQLRTMHVSVLNAVLLQTIWGMPDSAEHIRYETSVTKAIQMVRDHGGLAVLLTPPRQAELQHAVAAGLRVPPKTTSLGPQPHPGLVFRTFDEA